MPNDLSILGDWIEAFRPKGQRSDLAKPYILNAFENVPTRPIRKGILTAAYNHVGGYVHEGYNRANAFRGHFWALNLASYGVAFHENLPFGNTQTTLSKSGVGRLRIARDILAIAAIASGAGVHRVTGMNFLGRLPVQERDMHGEKYQKVGAGGADDVPHEYDDAIVRYSGTSWKRPPSQASESGASDVASKLRISKPNFPDLG